MGREVVSRPGRIRALYSVAGCCGAEMQVVASCGMGVADSASF